LLTGQIMATDLSRDARGQAEQMLDHLDGILAKAGGDRRRLLRLNVYVTSGALTAAMDAALAARFRDAPPVVTLMVTPLPELLSV